MNTYSTACHSVGASFIPLVIESLGGWDEEVVDVFKSIGPLLGQRLGISPAETMRHLFQRLVFCLWRKEMQHFGFTVLLTFTFG